MMFKEQQGNKWKHNGPYAIENQRAAMHKIISESKKREASEEAFKELQKTSSAANGSEEMCFFDFSPLFSDKLAFQEFCEHVLCVVVGQMEQQQCDIDEDADGGFSGNI